MKRQEAEKLLGGYAMGILTEAERRALFEAALEHQEIFDALMEEEALRELLADPAVRRHLLSLLSEPAPLNVRPFWRKPAVLGLAASLFLVVTTSLVLRRQPPGTLQTRLSETAKAEQEGVVDLAAKAAPVEVPGIAKPQVRKTEGTARRAAVPPASKQAPAPTEALREAYASAEAKVAPSADREKGLQVAESSALGAAAPSPAAPGPVMAKRTKAASGFAETDRAETKVGASRPGGVAFLSHTLQRLPDGRYRLAVTWEGTGHVYLLRRAAAVSEIPATSTTSRGQRRTAVFELALEPEQVLDLYLRPRPEPDPSALPPSDDGQGQWQRVTPEAPEP